MERREAEEVRKMYNEEVEEDEGEMTGEGGMEAYVLLIANFSSLPYCCVQTKYVFVCFVYSAN